MAELPDKQRKVAGSKRGPRKTTVTSAPVEVVDHALTFPVDLVQQAQRIYLRVMDELSSRELRGADRDAIVMLCNAAHIYYEATAKIAETGVLVKGPSGPIVNPLIRVAREEASMFMKLAAELGLTFASRVRLGEVDSDARDEINIIIASLRSDT
jgi:P27 family predicted phage terminase small subunit